MSEIIDATLWFQIDRDFLTYHLNESMTSSESTSHFNKEVRQAEGTSDPSLVSKLPTVKGMASTVQRNLPPGAQRSQVSTVMSDRGCKPSAFRRWGVRLAAPIVLAGATIYAVNQYMSARRPTSPQKTPPAMVERIVAAENLLSGSEIEVSNLALREIPEDRVPRDSLEPDEIESLLGMRLTQDLVAGEPLTFSILRRAQPNGFLEFLMPGYRAVTLPVGRITSDYGLLQSGEYIDLFVTFEHRGRRITSLLMSQIRVLHVSRSERDGYPGVQDSLTLEVSPEQAAKLIAAQQGGVLTAVQMPAPTQVGLQESQHLRSHSNVSQAVSPGLVANHLAGFAGVEPSFEQFEAPDILYGDQERVAGQN